MHDLPIPEEILEMQQWFAKIITSPIGKTDKANIPLYPRSLVKEMRKRIAPSPTLTSEERIGIYNQQYWWRLLTVMQENYPSLIRLFDYRDFNCEIAAPYLLACPPNDWSLSRIGGKLPDWLKKNYREKDSSLVTELAHLDLAYERLLFAEILPAIEPKDMPQCETKKLYLQPHVLLFHLDADLFTFRAELLKHPPAHWQAEDFPKIKKNPKCFVLYREKERDFYEEISKPRFALLSRFQKGPDSSI